MGRGSLHHRLRPIKRARCGGPKRQRKAAGPITRSQLAIVDREPIPGLRSDLALADTRQRRKGYFMQFATNAPAARRPRLRVSSRSAAGTPSSAMYLSASNGAAGCSAAPPANQGRDAPSMPQPSMRSSCADLHPTGSSMPPMPARQSGYSYEARTRSGIVTRSSPRPGGRLSPARCPTARWPRPALTCSVRRSKSAIQRRRSLDCACAIQVRRHSASKTRVTALMALGD